MSECRWVGSDRPRMTRGHLAECETVCEGCAPCPERHCQICGKEHVTLDRRGDDQTCASCIGAVRDDLAKIGTYSARMLGEAIRRGISSQATMLAGPAADPEAWGYRRMSALARRIDPSWLEDCRDEMHPTWVVGTWEMLTREHLSQPTDERLTLTEARAYLDGHLTRLAHDPGFPFDELARGLRSCRGHLEDVLRDGEQVERGAPCPMCGAKHLVKVYAETEDDDRWTCPKCRHWWTEDDYREKVDGIYVGVADRLTASQIAKRLRVPEGSVRGWASQGKVRKYGKDHQGRQLYDVADVEQARDTKASA